MANAAPQLQEAYDLIEAGDLQSARQLLDDIRSSNENNPDFWWIYSHAVENEEDGLAALDRVRQIAPNYPGLQSLSEELGITTPKAPPTFKPPVPTPTTESIESFYQQDKVSHVNESEESSFIPFYLIAGVAIIAVIAALFFISSLFGGNNDDTDPTEVAIFDESVTLIVPTLIAEAVTEEVESATAEAIETEEVEEEPTAETVETEEVEPTEVEEEPTAEIAETEEVEPTEFEEEPTAEIVETEEVEPTAIATEIPEDVDPFAEIYTDLEEFGVPVDGISISETDSFGETYAVTTCSAIGPIATQNILSIMESLQSVADTLDENVSGISFEITDCENDTVRLALGFDRDTADSYWNGDISETELQQALQRVN
ncbi:MAG: hypothetical protein Phog2KO_16380 [Phototrophicaceae bacterium]